ncbi:hypervirulence associated TUDOR domain-containing protein [Micromonospora tarensis]|uniref:DUF2945 domain-containing protein n=1 Tax=Micromonospora tarensis TaxID=2806100 RepID=A0ABS1YG60_9ACTN|nr:DUF2945 domain-containing protein [Micromonospora tarensis]MBM0276400.1 DUF2945 domain-containing protein [Micromonospora tarensis]
MAEQRFHQGDQVSWSAHGSRAYGVVRGTITERTRLRGRTVNASPDDPQYRVRSAGTGRDVAHRPGALRHEQG